LDFFWLQVPQDGTSLAIQLLDVAVVAYLVYRLLLLVRGSRAWRVLGGVITYLLLWFVSGLFGLKTLHFILDKALVLAPVAIVILLLPELRSALEGFGRLGFWPDRLRGGQDHTRALTIEEVVAAVAELSAGSTGALLVIERSRHLPEIETTGVALDAKITASLLIQIFYDKTPLHDGATILRGDRIVASACQLPLSETRLPTHLHLRHRAAVGVTENTDALAVVVSEERGTISVAIDGIVRESLSPADLRQFLREQLKEMRKPRRTLVRQREKDEELAV
jgi:diadenylate cyclase